MTYLEFVLRNKALKNKHKPIRILSVSYTVNRCDLSDSKYRSVNDVVNGVSSGQIYLSNPSKLAHWKGFSTRDKVENATKNNEYPFNIVDRTPRKVTLRINTKNISNTANRPYLNTKMDYIEVTRGEEHTLTITNKSGGRFSFDWGPSGHTLISESLEHLKRDVIKFIEDESHILLGWDDGKVDEVSIYFNGNFGLWQLELRGNRGNRKISAAIRNRNAKSYVDMIEYARYFVDISEWEQGVTKTGIPIWRGKLK